MQINHICYYWVSIVIHWFVAQATRFFCVYWPAICIPYGSLHRDLCSDLISTLVMVPFAQSHSCMIHCSLKCRQITSQISVQCGHFCNCRKVFTGCSQVKTPKGPPTFSEFVICWHYNLTVKGYKEPLSFQSTYFSYQIITEPQKT